MRLAVLLFAFIALSALSAEDPKHDKARRECNKQGEVAGNKAVAEAKMKHPGEVTLIKKQAKLAQVNICMRQAGYASGPVRAK